MTAFSAKYHRPILLASAVAMMSLVYKYRHELIGDLSKDRAALYQQTDMEGSQKIKENIQEAQADFFKGLMQGKKW